MAETILLVAKILCVLFIVCKFISTFTHISDRDEAIEVMGTSLALRAGGFSSKRTE